MNKVKVRKGEVWESTLRSRREVLEVTDSGGAIVKESNGHTFYWCPENVNSETFYKLISKSATVYTHIPVYGSPYPPWGYPSAEFFTQFGPPYNFRCISEPIPFTAESDEEEDVRQASCYRCGKTYRINLRESPSLRPLCSVCGWEMIMGKPSKIDTVKVRQVWKGVQEKCRRTIVSVTREEGKVAGIGTRRSDTDEAASWDRGRAEEVVLGELVEDELELKHCLKCGQVYDAKLSCCNICRTPNSKPFVGG